MSWRAVPVNSAAAAVYSVMSKGRPAAGSAPGSRRGKRAISLSSASTAEFTATAVSEPVASVVCMSVSKPRSSASCLQHFARQLLDQHLPLAGECFRKICADLRVVGHRKARTLETRVRPLDLRRQRGLGDDAFGLQVHQVRHPLHVEDHAFGHQARLLDLFDGRVQAGKRIESEQSEQAAGGAPGLLGPARSLCELREVHEADQRYARILCAPVRDQACNSCSCFEVSISATLAQASRSRSR